MAALLERAKDAVQGMQGAVSTLHKDIKSNITGVFKQPAQGEDWKPEDTVESGLHSIWSGLQIIRAAAAIEPPDQAKAAQGEERVSVVLSAFREQLEKPESNVRRAFVALLSHRLAGDQVDTTAALCVRIYIDRRTRSITRPIGRQ
jgi:hypothetical protein